MMYRNKMKVQQKQNIIDFETGISNNFLREVKNLLQYRFLRVLVIIIKNFSPLTINPLHLLFTTALY